MVPDNFWIISFTSYCFSSILSLQDVPYQFFLKAFQISLVTLCCGDLQYLCNITVKLHYFIIYFSTLIFSNLIDSKFIYNKF